MSKQFNLITALSLEECTTRLIAAIDHESLDLSRLQLDFNRGSKPVIGELTDESFVLRNRIMGRGNSFTTFATGTIQPTENGTKIAGQLSAHPGFRLGSKAWGCCMFFIGAPIIWHLLYELHSGTVRLNGLWSDSYQTETMGLLMLLAFPLMYAVGRGDARQEATFLQYFLAQTLEAHPV